MKEIEEIPPAQRFADRPMLVELFAGSENWTKAMRNQVFRKAYFDYGYKLAEIAAAADVHYTTVSKAKQTETLELKTPFFFLDSVPKLSTNAVLSLYMFLYDALAKVRLCIFYDYAF